jgi:SpoVK/Ycf46/Vps4 family AAA+-type ATPase
MELLCREAAMRPVRRLMTKLDELSTSAGGTGGIASAGNPSSKVPRSRVRIAQITEPAVNVEALLRGDPVTQEDLLTALGNTKRSSDGNMDKYNAWQEEFGSA